MLGIVIKIILIFFVLLAILMYLVIVGANISKSVEKQIDDEEEMKNTKNDFKE